MFGCWEILWKIYSTKAISLSTWRFFFCYLLFHFHFFFHCIFYLPSYCRTAQKETHFSLRPKLDASVLEKALLLFTTSYTKGIESWWEVGNWVYLTHLSQGCKLKSFTVTAVTTHTFSHSFPALTTKPLHIC